MNMTVLKTETCGPYAFAGGGRAVQSAACSFVRTRLLPALSNVAARACCRR